MEQGAQNGGAGPSVATYQSQQAAQATPSATGGTLACSIVPPPGLKARATAPFKVADFKRECAEFVWQMEALLQGGGQEEEGLDVSDLRPKTLKEEMAELQSLGAQVQRQQQEQEQSCGQQRRQQQQPSGQQRQQQQQPGGQQRQQWQQNQGQLQEQEQQQQGQGRQQEQRPQDQGLQPMDATGPEQPSPQGQPAAAQQQQQQQGEGRQHAPAAEQAAADADRSSEERTARERALEQAAGAGSGARGSPGPHSGAPLPRAGRQRKHPAYWQDYAVEARELAASAGASPPPPEARGSGGEAARPGGGASGGPGAGERASSEAASEGEGTESTETEEGEQNEEEEEEEDEELASLLAEERRAAAQRAAAWRSATPAAAPATAAGAQPVPKSEAKALLAAYRERAEAVRARRAAEAAAAAATLHSVRAGATGRGAGRVGRDPEMREKTLWRLGASVAAGEAAAAAGAARRAGLPAPRARVPGRMQTCCAAAARQLGLVPAGEVVLRVRVGVPHAPQQMWDEYLVLGRRRLTELRDVIYCLSDTNVAAVEKEENEARAAAEQPPLSLVRRSAYLYVEGTFYNDVRAPGAQDYSELIRRHNRRGGEGRGRGRRRRARRGGASCACGGEKAGACTRAGGEQAAARRAVAELPPREHRVQAPPHPPPDAAPGSDVLTTEFSTASMEDTRFDDLWLRVGGGAGNLYCHQARRLLSAPGCDSARLAAHAPGAARLMGTPLPLRLPPGGCEHLVSFQEVRAHDAAADPPLLSDFPFRLARSHHVVTRNCEVCGQRPAKKVTHDDPATPHTPFFWRAAPSRMRRAAGARPAAPCQAAQQAPARSAARVLCAECYTLAHYGEGGQALYTDYRVFPYLHEYGVTGGGGAGGGFAW
eukprot:scaffold9.g3248.t1